VTARGSASEMALLSLLTPVPHIAASPNHSVAMLQNAGIRMPHAAYRNYAFWYLQAQADDCICALTVKITLYHFSTATCYGAPRRCCQMLRCSWCYANPRPISNILKRNVPLSFHLPEFCYKICMMACYMMERSQCGNSGKFPSGHRRVTSAIT
jgi:hypothetical protein